MEGAPRLLRRSTTWRFPGDLPAKALPGRSLWRLQGRRCSRGYRRKGGHADASVLREARHIKSRFRSCKLLMEDGPTSPGGRELPHLNGAVCAQARVSADRRGGSAAMASNEEDHDTRRDSRRDAHKAETHDQSGSGGLRSLFQSPAGVVLLAGQRGIGGSGAGNQHHLAAGTGFAVRRGRGGAVPLPDLRGLSEADRGAGGGSADDRPRRRAGVDAGPVRGALPRRLRGFGRVTDSRPSCVRSSGNGS